MNNVYLRIDDHSLAVIDITLWTLNLDGWYISRILVSAKYRNQGYGTQLMRMLEQPIGTDLYVHPTANYGSDVQRLVQFFERFGFHQIKAYDFPFMIRKRLTNMITLYRRHQTGRIGTWQIWNEGNIIYMVTRTNAEAQPVYHTEVVPTGKAGRTLEQQVESRINSRVRAKLDQGYKLTRSEAMTSDNTNAIDLPRPMLASSDSTRLLAKASTVFVQPKLDGMRMIVAVRNGKAFAYTRQGKPITTVDHILAPLTRVMNDGMYLDGELYAHGQSLQQIMSWAKRKQPNSEHLQYHVFDSISDDSFIDRWEYLQQWYLDCGSIHNTTVLVPTDDARAIDLSEAFACARADGYEGLILRDGGARYEPGKRAWHLAKVKAFAEEEFLCTDLTTGAKGEPVLICTTGAGKPFKVTAPGTHEHRRKAAMYVGQRVTIKHAGLTPYGIPFHPVCLGFKS